MIYTPGQLERKRSLAFEIFSASAALVITLAIVILLSIII